MSDVLSLLQETAVLNENYAPILLKAIKHKLLEDDSKTKHNDLMITKINSLLNNTATRGQAFTFLMHYLPGCSVDVLNERGLVWLNASIKTCGQKHLPNCLIGNGLDVIRILIERSVDASEFMKQINHSLLQKILETAYNTTANNVEYKVINCIIQCMLSYPGLCGPSKNVVEKIAFKYIDSTSTELVRGAALMLFLMQLTRSGGEAKILHKKYFTEYSEQIIGSIHQCFNELFTNVEESFEIEPNCDETKLKLPELILSNDPVIKVAQMTQRILNLMIIFKEILISPYNAGKVVRPHKIFGMIRRGLDVNQHITLKNQIMDNILLSSLIPQIHAHLFGILGALVVLLQKNTRTFCKDIILIYESSLKWSSTRGKNLGCKKLYSDLRVMLYDSLIQYCKILEKGSLLENIGEVVVANIIEDTIPYKPKIVLQNSFSKKVKKKVKKIQSDNSNLEETSKNKFFSSSHTWEQTDEPNYKLCVSALRMLSVFIHVSGYNIKPTLHRILQQHILQLCLQIDIKTLDKTHLYYSDSCRYFLYDTLSALICNAHHLAPPPLQYTIKILTNACITDPSSVIRQKCQELIKSIEKIVNPQRTIPHIKMSKEELNSAIKLLCNDEDEDTDNSNEIIYLNEDEQKNNEKSVNLNECILSVDEPNNSLKYDKALNNIITNSINLCTDTIDQKNLVTELDLEYPPEKRLKKNNEDLLVDELVETFVDE
ncbi:proline-, glutamic acid- and leucine-rich protein 1-like isoform X2 [Culicoides brevitarsis]|uniref:proline-, glutamic acid- and leucine-rich protein 1-like isoform X2 n=1 Tax=Culicoides brevitarsis TaxID=469753 RepID=UPI00307C0595